MNENPNYLNIIESIEGLIKESDITLSTQREIIDLLCDLAYKVRDAFNSNDSLRKENQSLKNENLQLNKSVDMLKELCANFIESI